MAVSYVPQNSFTAGELDPKLRGRSDIQAYYAGASKIRNALVMPQGGVRRRPGLEYIAETVSGSVKLIPFVYTTDTTYMIVLSTDLFTIYKDGQVMDTVACTITDTQVSEVTWAQSYDTLILFHKSFAPKYLLRASDTSWSTGTWALNNVPTYNAASTATTTSITIRDSAGAVIDFSSWTAGDYMTDCKVEASGATFVAGDLGKHIVGPSGGRLVITTVTDGDSVVGTILREFKINMETDGIDLPAGDWTLEVPSISSTTGYPACGTFFQGRLWMAGTTVQPNAVWASKVNDEHNFSSWSPSLADDGIYLLAGGGIMSVFHRMYGGKHLFLFANTGEFYVPISNTEPVTPENVSLVRNASNGSKEGVEVFDVDGNITFLKAGGRSVISATYEYTSGGYTTVDLSMLASHLLNDSRCMAYKKQQSTNDSDYLYAVNSDGTLAVLCTLMKQNITAWSLCETDGEFREVCVDSGDVYFVVDRIIDGTRRSYIERFNDGLLVDSGVINPRINLTYGGVQLTYYGLNITYNTSEYSSISGLAHLAGESISIIVDNTIQPAQTVNVSGVVTLVTAGDDAQAGLPFPIVDTTSGSRVFIETMPIIPKDAQGSPIGRKKRISEVTAMLYETSHLEVQSNRYTIRRIGIDKLDSSVPKLTEDITMSGLLGWADELTIQFGQTLSLPLTLLGMSCRVRV